MGIQGIVRVGSRSQSKVLESLNLFENTKDAQSRSQAYLLSGYYKEAEAVEQEMHHLVDRLRVFGTKDPPWSAICNSMAALAPSLYQSLVPGGMGGADEQDFFQVPLDQTALFKRWLQGRGSTGPQAQGRRAAQGGPRIHGSRFALLDDPEERVMDPETPAVRNVPQPPPAAANSDRPVNVLLLETDAWSLSRGERRRVVEHLMSDAKAELVEGIQNRMRRYQEVLRNLRSVHDEVSTEVLRSAKVVGMTTAGVASQQSLIAAVGFKIVVVEEAAEVLEAHILAGLGPQTEQLILIGDHKQLRPKIQTYELSMDSGRGYNLDLSLFERLVEQSDYPVVTLQQQHRMRPEISQLIRAPIYPALQDHPKVEVYEHVKGMKHDVFFITHTNPEVGDKEESNSKTNAFEAEFVARLALYLAQQGTRKGQITVLTAYVGQLLELRKALARRVCVTLDDRDAEELAQLEEEAELEGTKMAVGQAVRLATVDNFQGEESDIIILSLVRSHRANNIGFLKAANRTNVALSRAKRGLYIVGNAQCLTAAKSAGIWPHVIATLEEGGRIGPALPLVCQNHPDTVTEVKHWEDFDRLVSDGGCSRRCTVRLPCGQTCPKLCHSDDRPHKHVHCPEPCLRPRSCGHPCSKPCGDRCGDCTALVASVGLPCGHCALKVPCYRAQKPEGIKCLEQVHVRAPHCGHGVVVPCYKVAVLKEEPWLCPHLCGSQLGCGHPCSSTCGACLASTLRDLPGGNAYMVAKAMASAAQPAKRAPAFTVPLPAAYKHPSCSRVCERTLHCGHLCGQKCHEEGGVPCPPCWQRCPVKCCHSKCSRSCAEPCPPCAEPCSWECKHQGACLLPCGAPCARLPCDKRCNRLLPCGHRCPGVCGEDCPPKRYCITCGSKDIIVEDVYLMEEKAITQLSQEEVTEDPLVVLPCGHAFFMSAMDQHMELEWTERSLPGSDDLEKRGAYIKGSTGHWERPAPLAERMGSAKTCMKCRAPVGQLRRYGRMLNKLAADSAERKFVQACNSRLASAERSMQDLQRQLSGARLSALGASSTPAEQRQRWERLEGLAKQGKAVPREFQGISRDARQPPTLQMYTAARMYVLHLAERSKVPSSQTEGLLGGLVAPHPDMTNLIKALIGKAQTARELVQLLELEWAVAKVEYSAIDSSRARRAQRGLLEVAGMLLGEEVDEEEEPPQLTRKQLAQVATLKVKAASLERDLKQVLREGNEAVGEAVDLAEEHHNYLRQAHVLRVSVQLLLARAALAEVKANSAVCQLLGEDESYIAKQSDLKKRLLQTAEQECRRGLAVEATAARLGLGGEEGTRNGFEELLKKVQEARKANSPEELREIYQALVEGERSLANPGWYHTGHFMVCPGGHMYVVGNCGGVQQGARCPECGAAIGGHNYQVAEGNRPATEFLALVQGRG